MIDLLAVVGVITLTILIGQLRYIVRIRELNKYLQEKNLPLMVPTILHVALFTWAMRHLSDFPFFDIFQSTDIEGTSYQPDEKESFVKDDEMTFHFSRFAL